MNGEQEKFDQTFHDLQNQKRESNNIIDNTLDKFSNLKISEVIDNKVNKKVFSANEIQEMQKQNDMLLRELEKYKQIASGNIPKQNQEPQRVMETNVPFQAVGQMEGARPKTTTTQGRRQNFDSHERMYVVTDEQRTPFGNIPLNAALTTIPNYDGRPETLSAFAKVIRDILETYGPNSEKWILNTIATKLRGKAQLSFGGTAPAYDNIEQLLQDFKLTFGGIQDADTLRLEMRRVEQDEEEAVADYALRVQNLEQRLITLYDSSVGMRAEEKEYQKRRTRSESLQCFLFGLRDPPEYRVAAMKPTTLRQAASMAVNLEGRTKILQRHENCATSHRNIATAHRMEPKRNSAEMAADTSPQDIGDLWAMLAPIVAKVKAATTVKLECKFCKGEHDVKNCEKLFKMIESGEFINQKQEVGQTNNRENQYFPYPFWAAQNNGQMDQKPFYNQQDSRPEYSNRNNMNNRPNTNFRNNNFRDNRNFNNGRNFNNRYSNYQGRFQNNNFRGRNFENGNRNFDNGNRNFENNNRNFENSNRNFQNGPRGQNFNGMNRDTNTQRFPNNNGVNGNNAMRNDQNNQRMSNVQNPGRNVGTQQNNDNIDKNKGQQNLNFSGAHHRVAMS